MKASDDIDRMLLQHDIWRLFEDPSPTRAAQQLESLIRNNELDELEEKFRSGTWNAQTSFWITGGVFGLNVLNVCAQYGNVQASRIAFKYNILVNRRDFPDLIEPDLIELENIREITSATGHGHYRFLQEVFSQEQLEKAAQYCNSVRGTTGLDIFDSYSLHTSGEEDSESIIERKRNILTCLMLVSPAEVRMRYAGAKLPLPLAAAPFILEGRTGPGIDSGEDVVSFVRRRARGMTRADMARRRPAGIESLAVAALPVSEREITSGDISSDASRASAQPSRDGSSRTCPCDGCHIA
jgi:hypothetical protein